MKSDNGGDRIRPSAEFLDVCADFATRTANSGALFEGLSEVVDRWPDLPAELRSDIIDFLRKAERSDGQPMIICSMRLSRTGWEIGIRAPAIRLR